MDKPNPSVPYRQLGKKLKELRDSTGESLAEASGAVEIDVKQLANFELGKNRPSEDILLLLISHFGVKDDVAVKLWELAGYEMTKIPAAHMTNIDAEGVAAMLAAEPKVLFTDIVDVMVNNHGVVMNFMQSGGTAKTPSSVARVGMSREHAKSVLQILQMTLHQSEQNLNQTTKKLSAPDNQTPDSNSSN